jgi:hypothetical protein
MIILLAFMLQCLYSITYAHDTTIAPRQTITAYELAAKNQGLLFPHTIHSRIKNSLQKFVLELSDAYVYEDGHIITRDHLLLEETIIKYPEKPLSEYHMLNRKDLPCAEHFSGRLAVIASPGAQCYYHWMFQILPRLKILKDLQIPFDALYIEPLTCSFQLETLAKIGLAHKKIVFAKPDTHINADVLLIPSIVVKEPNIAFPEWVIEFLRSEFLDRTFIEKFKDFKKIYISRNKAASRRIVNEQELIQSLSKQGFITIYSEHYSLMEQAALIHNADVIISPHGSGLSNLVFAHKGASVIEIFNQHGFNKLFYHLAQAVGLKHLAVLCSDEQLSDTQKDHEDIYVDIHYLEKLLQTL